MKRNASILAGIAALGVSVCLGGQVQAQPGQIVQATTAAATPKTRVALVNLPQVIKTYMKYQSFEHEWQETYKSFDKQYEGKRTLLVTMQADAQKQTDPAGREMAERKVRDLQREMQDMGEEAKKQLGKKRDDQAVIIYKEIEEAVQVYARAKDIELVMHFNDAIAPNDLYNPMNIQRKLQIGATFPIYSSPGMDITKDIVEMLNTRYQRMQQATGAPAGTPAAAAPQR